MPRPVQPSAHRRSRGRDALAARHAVLAPRRAARGLLPALACSLGLLALRAHAAPPSAPRAAPPSAPRAAPSPTPRAAPSPAPRPPLPVSAQAGSPPAPPAALELAALAPAPSPADDARRAVAIGPAGEVYEPDGKGAWVRRQRHATAGRISLAARAGGAVLALGDGVVYRLAPNGWSALRLAQKDKARLSAGWTAVAAVGRQLLALDRMAGGEPAKLGAAAADVLLVGSGQSVVVATDRGLFRLTGPRLAPIAAPRRARLLVGDRWAIVDGGAVDLRTGKTTPWPPGAAIDLAAPGPDDGLAAVARAAGQLELLAIRGGKLTRAPIQVAGPAPPAPAPVGLAVDRAGRAVIAFRDGRLAIRDGAGWATVTVAEELPPPRPGPPPAPSR